LGPFWLFLGYMGCADVRQANSVADGTVLLGSLPRAFSADHRWARWHVGAAVGLAVNVQGALLLSLVRWWTGARLQGVSTRPFFFS
jgi:hypothetical protein